MPQSTLKQRRRENGLCGDCWTMHMLIRNLLNALFLKYDNKRVGEDGVVFAESWCLSQVAIASRRLWIPGEDQVTWRVRQPTHYILHIPSKQALKLCSQPALQWTLCGRQFLQGLSRLLCV